MKHPGYSFASKLEAQLFDYLQKLEHEGDLSDIQHQDHVYLTKARILYIVDFKVFDKRLGDFVWYEAKGFETPIWRIKRQLWLYYGPGDLRVFNSRCVLKETLSPR